MSDNQNITAPAAQQIHIHMANDNRSGSLVIGLLIIIFSGFYLLPTGIRVIKGKPAAGAAVINLLFGWTIIVWIIQLFTALK